MKKRKSALVVVEKKEKKNKLDQSIKDHLTGYDSNINLNTFLDNISFLEKGKPKKKAKKKQNSFISKRSVKNFDKLQQRKKLRTKSKSMKTFKRKTDMGISKEKQIKAVKFNMNEQLNNLCKEFNIKSAFNEEDNQQKISVKRSSKVYDRLNNYKKETEKKVEQLRQEKLTQEQQNTPFRPQLQKKRNKSRNSFIEENNDYLVKKEEKLLLKQRIHELEKDIDYQRNCTFKPRINTITKLSQRSVNDLYDWQKKTELKKQKVLQKKEQEFNKLYSFSPNINKKRRRGDEEKGYSNAGERLYAQYKVKEERKSKDPSLNRRSSQKKISYKDYNTKYSTKSGEEGSNKNNSFRRNSRQKSGKKKVIGKSRSKPRINGKGYLVSDMVSPINQILDYGAQLRSDRKKSNNKGKELNGRFLMEGKSKIKKLKDKEYFEREEEALRKIKKMNERKHSELRKNFASINSAIKRINRSKK